MNSVNASSFPLAFLNWSKAKLNNKINQSEKLQTKNPHLIDWVLEDWEIIGKEKNERTLLELLDKIQDIQIHLNFS